MKKRAFYLISFLLFFALYFNCAVDLEKTGALLEVSPGLIRFTAKDTLAVVTVKNMGNEVLNWNVQSAPEWLIFSRQNSEVEPGVADTFSVKYEKSLLNTIEELRENIVLGSNVNSASIAVIFQSEQPNLQTSVSKLEFGLNDEPQSLVISNSRNGFLDWKATVSVDWFSVSIDTGHTSPDAPDTMFVTVHKEKLPGPGEYPGMIQISSDANGPTFGTKISAKINVSFYYLGVETQNLRDGSKLVFPLLSYQGAPVPVAAEFFIKPVGQKKTCKWELVAGQLPAEIQFDEAASGGAMSAHFTGSVSQNLSTALTLRVTDGLNSSIELPVELVTRNVEVNAPQMAAIPAGSFTMGDSWGDGLGVERPAHSVTLDAFQLGIYEVTNEDFYKFVLARGYQTKEYWLITDGSASEDAGWNEIQGNNLSQPRFWNNRETPWDTCTASIQPNSPVVGISWYEACAYCRWMSQLSGKAFRLPAEAQWERVARGAGTGTKYPWGDDWNAALANWDENGAQDGHLSTAPVGIFENGKSTAGCYDLAGNAWEWCSDWYAAYQSSPLNEPQGPATGSARVVKGGSWKSIPRSLRTVSRTKLAPESASRSVGFRLGL